MVKDPKFDTHTLLAVAILALFASQNLLPYWFGTPKGVDGTILISDHKTVENVLMLVIGYYFGSSQESKKKTDALADTAAAAAASTPAAGTATVTAAPDVDITVREAELPT